MNATRIQHSMGMVLAAVFLLLTGALASLIPGPIHAYSVVLQDSEEIPIYPGQTFLKNDFEIPLPIRLSDEFMDHAFAKVPATWKTWTEADKAKRASWISTRAGTTENSLRRFLKRPSNGLTTDEWKCLDQELNLQVTTRLEDAFIRPMNCLGPTRHDVKLSREARNQAWAGFWIVLGGTAVLGALQNRKYKQAHRDQCEKYGM